MKPMLRAYFWHSLDGQLSVTQDILFCLKLFKEISFLSGPERSSHSLGAKDRFSAVLFFSFAACYY